MLSRTAHVALLVSLFACGSSTSIHGQCTERLSSARAAAAATGVSGRILVAGGSNSATVDVYDVQTGAWSLASLSLGRGNLVAVTLGGTAFFAGGGRSSPTFQFNHSDRVDVFDSATGQWGTASLSEARSSLAAASVGDTVLFAGGWISPVPPAVPSATVDLYSPANGWTTTTLSTPRLGLAATAVGGTALFAGGSDSNGASDVVDLYDSATGQWTTATLSVARSNLAATSVGSLALFAGGSGGAAGPTDVVDIYDRATGLWSTARLSQPRSDLAAVTIGSLALFAGGAGLAVSDVVDVYDERTGRWFTTRLTSARVGMAAAAVDGRAVFAAGLEAGSETDSVDVFTAGLPAPFGTGDPGCPCGNLGGALTGCANSTGAGASLSGSGCALAGGTLTLRAAGLVPFQSAVLFRGTSVSSGLPFGDGLLYLAGPQRRVRVMTADAAGSASFGPGTGTTAPRAFQVWYRDPTGPCGAGFNVTGGLRLQQDP